MACDGDASRPLRSKQYSDSIFVDHSGIKIYFLMRGQTITHGLFFNLSSVQSGFHNLQKFCLFLLWFCALSFLSLCVLALFIVHLFLFSKYICIYKAIVTSVIFVQFIFIYSGIAFIFPQFIIYCLNCYLSSLQHYISECSLHYFYFTSDSICFINIFLPKLLFYYTSRLFA